MTVTMPHRVPWPMYAVPVWAALWVGSLLVAGDGGAAMLAVGLVPPALVLSLWAWVVFGREEVGVAGGRLTLRRHVGPLSSRRSFAAREVADLRAVEQRHGLAERLGVPSAALAFEHDGRPVLFGAGLDEDDARALAARLREALRA